MAEDARVPAAAPTRRRGRARSRDGRADLHRRGLGQALRREGDRAAVRGAARRDGDGAAPAAPRAQAPRARRARGGGGGGGGDTLPSPLQGNVLEGRSSSRATTSRRAQLLCIIEAMKMENEITAHKAGTIVELPITEGAPIRPAATRSPMIKPPLGRACVEPPRSRAARADLGSLRRRRRGGSARQLGALGAVASTQRLAGTRRPRSRIASACARRRAARRGPGTTCSAALHQRRAGARASRGRRRPSRPSDDPSGSRPATGSRRTTSTPAHGDQIAMPSAVWPSAGCSSSSRSPSSQCPGTGSA